MYEAVKTIVQADSKQSRMSLESPVRGLFNIRGHEVSWHVQRAVCPAVHLHLVPHTDQKRSQAKFSRSRQRHQREEKRMGLRS